MCRSFVNSADLFCYVCGEVMLASQRRSITPLIKKAYHLHFGCKLGDQDKKWVPHIVCKSCAIRPGGWISNKGMAMPFAVPVVWWELSNHSSDCYFCLTPPVASGMNRKKKQRIDYPSTLSAIRPVPHGEDLCEWDSRDKAHHYVKRILPARKILEPGHKNVKHHSLIGHRGYFCHLFISN